MAMLTHSGPEAQHHPIQSLNWTSDTMSTDQRHASRPSTNSTGAYVHSGGTLHTWHALISCTRHHLSVGQLLVAQCTDWHYIITKWPTDGWGLVYGTKNATTIRHCPQPRPCTYTLTIKLTYFHTFPSCIEHFTKYSWAHLPMVSPPNDTTP